MILRLAYRNIWRNKRRTLITAASILFAVFFAVVMRGIQVGSWQKMVDSVVHFYYGYAQVQAEGYWEEQSIDKSLLYDDTLKQTLAGVEGVRDFVPRLESFALAAYGDQSRGALLIGVDPEKEDALTNLSSHLVSGTFLKDGGVVLSSGLAEYLTLGQGDTAVFISQGFHGTNAAGKYAVTGIIEFPAPDLNKQLAFFSLDEAQWFYGAPDRVTSLVVDPGDPDDIKEITAGLRRTLNSEEYAVKDYEELIPAILEAKAFDEAGAFIIMFILYAIVGFGIFGTILMMLKEREYELGVLKAIGMKDIQLQGMLWLETMILALLGCIAGAAVSLPVVYYLTVNPIEFTGDMAEAYEKFGVDAVMPATVDLQIFLNQGLIVVVMVTIMAIYPMLKIRGLKPVKAMRP